MHEVRVQKAHDVVGVHHMEARGADACEQVETDQDKRRTRTPNRALVARRRGLTSAIAQLQPERLARNDGLRAQMGRDVVGVGVGVGASVGLVTDALAIERPNAAGRGLHALDDLVKVRVEGVIASHDHPPLPHGHHGLRLRRIHRR